MELILTLIFGLFAGSFIMWAWWTINPKLKSREKNIEKRLEFLMHLVRKLDQQRKDISARSRITAG